MIWVVFFLAFILFCCGWILFVPVVVKIDTDEGTYRVQQFGTVRFWLGTDFRPHLQVSGISVPLQRKAGPKPAKQPSAGPRKHSRKRRFSVALLRKLVNRSLSSLSIRQFSLDLDTDDVVLNAQLIPVFGLLSRGPVHLHINFQGHVYTRLYAEIRLYKLSWAFLLFLINHKLVWK